MSARSTRPFGRALLLSCALTALAVCGCSPATTDVSGTVTYQGKPLPAGSVTLVDSSGAVHQAQIQADGKFTVPNVPVGSVRVAVSTPKANRGKPSPFGGEPPPPPPAGTPELPMELANPDTSGLTGTVTAGQPLNINIPK